MRNEYYQDAKKFESNAQHVATILTGTERVLAKFGHYVVDCANLTPTKIISYWDAAVVLVTADREPVTVELRQAFNSCFESVVEVYWPHCRDIIDQFRSTRYGR